ncbi:MAG TPA: HlyD family efflux transporter periplasmic adaptor subunit [Planctomycetota bacterium]|nr:HlyD family efflux transporter periplasmic adaptor subunit [Planctomycetota bacterium]
MAANSNRHIGRWIVLLVLIAAVVLIVLRSRQPVEVEVMQARRGEIHESFREPARTRLARTWPITMPVQGRIERITLEPGDRVEAGQALVPFDLVPFEQGVAEARAAVGELKASLALKKDTRLENTGALQSRASVDAAREALKAAEAQVDAEKARSDRATKELQRMETLAATGRIAQNVLDDARLAAETSLIALRERQFNKAAMNAMLVVIELMPKLIDQYIARKDLEEAVLNKQLAQAEARLVQAEHDLKLARVVSPIDGVVLERYEQGSRFVAAGQPLLLLGSLDELEVIADVLTEDALKLKPGSEASLEPAAGLGPFKGKVKRIEPQGFTKLSSLGVEQQRVNVIVDFVETPTALGVEYRLQARFFTGTKADALILPRFAVMQSPEGDYYVFKVVKGKLGKQPVTLGLTSDLELEITGGLTEADTVAAAPDATMTEGMRIKVKQ